MRIARTWDKQPQSYQQVDAAAQQAAAIAEGKLDKAAADKAFRDVCGIVPDVGCKAQFGIIQAIVNMACRGANNRLAQLATAKPQQWPLLQQRWPEQMAHQ